MKKKEHITWRRWVLGLLLVATVTVMLVPGGNALYANHIYPVVGTVLSNLSSWIPFAVGDLFVMVSLAGVVLYPIFALLHPKKKFRKACGQVVEYLLWLFVWFYWAWGLNYGQPNYYERTGTRPVAPDEQMFKAFAHRYVEALNSNYTEVDVKDEDLVRSNVMAAYKLQGLNRIHCVSPHVKTMLYTPLASMVGVTGSMSPWLGEFTLNGDVQAHRFAATYAHEYAHLHGITSEGEANFYAYLATTQSTDKGIRFSGYYSILGYVLNSAAMMLNSNDYQVLYEKVRPEIKELMASDRAFWQERYSESFGRVQNYLYNLYLKYNKVEGGTKSYAEVVALILAKES
ncbi:MAG: DUF3810 domain-containing protein [Bacteroidaceae bacterium]|nr:DUF3810 domain-containing protein [Bacteroidaceae bacterium]